jgi:hypothetical protein
LDLVLKIKRTRPALIRTRKAGIKTESVHGHAGGIRRPPTPRSSYKLVVLVVCINNNT